MFAKILKPLFILSGFLPANYLLFLTILFLRNSFPIEITDNKHFIVFSSTILGVLGYFGLLLSLIPRIEEKYVLKISLLSIGVIGFWSFVTFVGDKNFWSWLIHIEKPDEWFIWVWPNIVSVVLIIYFSIKISMKTKKFRTQN